MSLNCTEIDRILAELSLTGFFIQDIVQPSFDSLALFLYRGAGEGRPPEPLTLFICLAHGACRLHAFSAKVPKMGKPLRFMECLRARIRGARVDSAEQLGRDRIVQISLSKGGETFFLFVRLWSGAANILLTDGGKRILDVFYRRPARGEISGAKWDWTPSVEEKDGGPSGLFPAREFPLPPGTHTRPYNRAVEFWYAAYAGTASRPALTEEADVDPAFARFISDSKISTTFLPKLKKCFTDKVIEKVMAKFPASDEEFLRVAVTFMTGGVMDVYVAWLRSENPMPLEDLCKYAATIVSQGYANIISSIVG